MKKKLFILFSFLNLLINAQPGKEAWHWRFGNKCTIDFSSGSPVTGIGNVLCQEVSATVSDENTGQLLFYTEGTHIYNRTGSVMANGYGIQGYGWTCQGALIVPQPLKNKYYLFTIPNSFIRYSQIDMKLQGGLGAVTSIKNRLLDTVLPCNKLTAVRHCNGVDYWVITHPYNSSEFHVFKVDSEGLDTVPVVSHVGTHIKQPGAGTPYERGYIKVSPNGKKLALAESDSLSFLELYDFDNSNGIISNPITIHFPYNGLPMYSIYYGALGPYGVSFSSDNTKLYTTLIRVPSVILQFDVSSNNPSAIMASQITIDTLHLSGSTSEQFCAMQLGPDGKIYVTREHNDTLALINNPNNYGSACNFQYQGLIFPYSHNTKMALPNFIDANYAGIQINIPDVQQCNTFTATTLDAGAGFPNYFWSTGASTQTISINAPGKYWVTVTNDQGCTRTDTIHAYLLNPLKVDTLACDTFKANVVQAGVLQYNWFDGSHAPIRNFTQSGTYYVDINYVSGCAIRDSITVTIVPSPQINIGPDTAFCKGDFKMDASCNTCTYQWTTGERSSSITVKTPGVYSVKVKDGNGCVDADTLTVRPQLSAFDFIMPNIVTPNDDKINDVVDFSNYQFSTFQIHIFNRWGQEIFKSEDPNAVWKPTQDDGTYYYTTQYRIDCTVDSQTKTLKGYIQVLR